MHNFCHRDTVYLFECQIYQIITLELESNEGRKNISNTSNFRESQRTKLVV